MPTLLPLTGDDPHEVRRLIAGALDGGPALGLGMLGSGSLGSGNGMDAAGEVQEGTAAVITTSGSTGVPKRVVLSADALRASAEATATRIGSGRWVLALPAAYVAGLQVLIRSHLAGTAPVVLEGRFSAEAFTAATRSALRTGDEALYTSLVPAQVATILAADDPAALDAARAYRAILVGGQALPAPLHDRAADLGIHLVRTYGSSETSGGCVYDGRPLDGVRVRVVDGELRIGGPTLADGYLGDDALTARVFTHDEHGTRWYRTGDLGEVDGDSVQVHGRADNVIISGGINVSLDRVERLVRSIPELTGAVIVAVDDARWGEASVIVVSRADAAGAAGDHLEAARVLVAEQIGKHARPVRLIAVDELPMLSSGKPDRARIRALAAASS